jgi:acid phosphatase type 7
VKIMATMKTRGVLKAALLLCLAATFWNGACGTEMGPPPANIQVNPATVTFLDTIGNGNPPAQTVAISTDNRDTVTGLKASITYTSGSGWLTVQLSDTLAPATMSLTSNMAGLTPSTYQATVTLTANDAANSPLTVLVAFEVAPPPPVRIGLSPSTITFAGQVGSSSPAAQTVSVSADGIGELTGMNATVNYGSGPAGWLNASLSGGAAPATLTLTANTAGLNAGTHGATVSVASPVAGNSPKDLPVTFQVAPQPPVTGITVVAVGNLGKCGSDLALESAKVVTAINPDYVLMLGNSTVPQTGTVTTLEDYMACYDPLWGPFKAKTYAALGTREVDIDTVPPDYGTGMALGADAYFGPERIGPPGKNWYSFDIGGWHVIALNAQSPGGYTRPKPIRFHAGSEQFSWLDRDLRNNSGKKCTLAFWYQSMWFSSTTPRNPGTEANDAYRIQDIRGIWTLLYQRKADLVVNGTPHIYERFAPMYYANSYQDPTPSEYAADPVNGIRQITSGLGGDGPINAAPTIVRHPLSEYRSGGNGVLKLVLGNGEYSWEFVNTKYSHIQDSGRGTCH